MTTAEIAVYLYRHGGYCAGEVFNHPQNCAVCCDTYCRQHGGNSAMLRYKITKQWLKNNPEAAMEVML